MLNEKQRKAVETTEGRVLILAGAGSGKTSVLTFRMAHLIREKSIDPAAILGMTFTNKAAQEMRQRAAQLVGRETAKKIFLSTFHSFCARILRQEIHYLGYTKDFSLYDEQDVRRLLKQLIRFELAKEGGSPLESTMEKIGLAKNRANSSSELSDPWEKQLYERLETCMRAYNAVDFDSLLSLTVKLFQEFPHVLERYQRRFLYIMIDEYQDTSPVQYQLAEMLAKPHGNLCVVGDDDQSIYSWRGAEVKNILHFAPEHTIKLEQNYRSTPTILRAAHAVISKNRERHGKELWSDREQGDPLSLFHAPTDVEEAQGVAERLVRLHMQGIPWKEMAILYRSNIQVRALELALMQVAWQRQKEWVRGIPYRVFGGTEFSERSEIKDLLAYLRIILNPQDEEALLRIMNVPRRGISDQTLDQLTQINRQKNIPLWQLAQAVSMHVPTLSERAQKAVLGFVQMIERAREKFAYEPLHTALEWLVQEINYKKAIEEEVKDEKARAFKWENVNFCIQALKSYEAESEEPSLHHFLTTTLLNNQLPKYEKNVQEDLVNLMTFHSAKGLEFEACFLVGLEDHLVPHEKSFSLEEERRLFYVAMTRAKKHLTLSMARARKRYGKETNSNPSRFLFDIPQDLVKLSIWNKNI